MAASAQAPVNERLYFCRLQLDSYRHLLALAEAPKAVVERAMGEASPLECTIQAASVQETEGQRNGRGDLRDHVGSI